MSAKDEIRRNTEEVQGPAAIANSGSADVPGPLAVMASEDFHRPGEASWSVDEIRYDEIERYRIKEDTRLLYLLTSASFIEITSDLYARNLIEFFGEDRETVQWLEERWEPAAGTNSSARFARSRQESDFHRAQPRARTPLPRFVR